ncbi:hypothetical protein HOF92_09715, partial [bacterium]|nr:hypothetical protein [bacterium]
MEEALRYHGILQKMDPRDQIKLIHTLGDSEEETELLLELLADPVYEFRRAAFETLQPRGTVLMESAVNLCRSPNADQRYWGMQLLIAIGKEAVSAVEVCVRDAEPSLQRLAVAALGDWKQGSSMSVLIELLGTSGWQIRQDVFNALACYGERVKEPITKVLDTANEDLFYWGVRLLGKMGARSRKNLVDLLKTSNRDRKFLIMSALAECGDREALELLIKSLSKSSGLSPKRASDAILRVGARALDPLVNALTDVPADQLYWYARTMIKLGRKGVDLLGDFLIERGEDYLWESRPAFEQLGVETLRTLEILIESPKKEVRVFAYQVLVDLDSEEACPILVQGLQDSAWVCKKMCADALIRAGDSALAAMRSLSSSSDPDELFWLIYVFKRSSEGRRRISELLRRTDKEVVSEAARALRDSVPEEAILPLLHCLRSESWVVRKEASESLVNAGPIAVSRIV